jgi:hypothetical protein
MDPRWYCRGVLGGSNTPSSIWCDVVQATLCSPDLHHCCCRDWTGRLAGSGAECGKVLQRLLLCLLSDCAMRRMAADSWWQGYTHMRHPSEWRMMVAADTSELRSSPWRCTTGCVCYGHGLAPSASALLL